jgi:serine/threonine protein kinase
VRYLHEKLVIHCDLKPENIMLVEDEPDGRARVKIGDFGVSFILPSAEHKPPLDFNVNSTGHKPPEILLVLPWGFGVDMFALGCTIATICGVRRHPLCFMDYSTGGEPTIQQQLDHILSGFGALMGADYTLLPPEMTYQRDVRAFGSVSHIVSFYSDGTPPSSSGRHPFAYITELMKGDDSLRKLVVRMLEPDPNKRITAANASLWVGDVSDN